MPRWILTLFFVALIGVGAHEAWRVFGPDALPPFWNRWQLRERAMEEVGSPPPTDLHKLKAKLAEYRRPVSESRTWTDVSGRKIQAVATAAADGAVQLRVLPAQTVHLVPLARLSAEDRDFVRRWTGGNPGIFAPDVSPSTHWPASFDGIRNTPLTSLPRADNSFRWQSQRYEFRSAGMMEEKSLLSIAIICESIDAAIRQAPLPLLWGRRSGERRVVVLHRSISLYEDAVSLPGSAGCFEMLTGHIHLCLPRLDSFDVEGMAREFSLEKRKNYRVLVHELVHQATPGIVYSEFPAWVPEVLADYFAATQYVPGRFRFRDSHAAVRGYLESGDVFGLQRYPVWPLEDMLSRPLEEWNRLSVRGARRLHDTAQYFQALVMVEYFARADSPNGHHFRAYLEAVMTGVPVEEATRVHLLRGRGFPELEQELAAYWNRKGIKLVYESSPNWWKEKVKFGVGIERSLHGPRGL